ncbi:MAG: uroporphyrinogen decarboxylase family protein [Anaerolineae bacterium]|jgi:AcrR family transcriptional regulator
MNDRQRLLAILAGQPPDRIPWIPRLLLWYNAHRRAGTLPDRWRDSTLRQVERDLGVGTPARDGLVCELALDGVEVSTRRAGWRQITTWHTPLGDLQRVEQQSAELERDGLPGRIVEYPLKREADYAAWAWVVERMQWRPTYDAFRTYDAEIGGDGLPMVAAGDVPLHDWLENLAGYEHGFYHLADWPAAVERLLGLLHEVQRERLWPLLAASPAQLLLHGVHLSSQFTPPRLFRRYVLPYYQELLPLLHGRGLRVAMHADNDTSAILALIEQAGWDMVECFVTAPMVPTTLAQARAAWGQRVVIWGGLPSVLLSPHVAEGEFRAAVRGILRDVAPGEAFILGVADNVMPDSLIERVAWVSEFMAREGWLPLAG